MTINRGKQDGIEGDMPVLTDEGLVGKTTTVSENISIVLLVSDENCRVAATVEGTREQGIVSGERVAGRVTPLLDLNFLVEASQPASRDRRSTRPAWAEFFPRACSSGRCRVFGCANWMARRGSCRRSICRKLEDVFVVTGQQMIFFRHSR